MEETTTGREIAVIGMAGRFPAADNVETFWENLKAGVEGITPVTAEDLQAAGLDPELLKDPNYVAAAASLDQPDGFDAAFFGYTPREAELMDPQHRVFLEGAWAALEDAGYDPERYGGLIGVFGGVARNAYLMNNLAARDELRNAAGEYHLLFGNEKDYPATRVAYKLNLKGPAFNVQCACSSSAVAVHLACQGLLTGDVDMALVGGCRVMVPARVGYRYVDGGTLSPDGHVRAFDAEARGMVRGSGVAFIVLKRLEDALQDGDSIQALILGTAINNDGGTKAGFSAPSVEGQAAVVAEALAVAGVAADTVSYVEAHGTATRLGDPIEVEALTRAFRQSTDRKQFCAIGSVKTNIGHLDAGSGVAGIIKTALSLKHRLLPPSLHFHRPNPNICFEDSPFYVNTELQPWRSAGGPLRAGVSSFGIGGTNVHVVMQEAPEPPPAEPSRPWQLLLVSAKTGEAREHAERALADHLARRPELVLADVAYTLHVGRRHFSRRSFVLCCDHDDAVAALSSQDPKRLKRGRRAEGRPSVVFLFPGQGVQHVHMAREIYEQEPLFRKIVNDCSQQLAPYLEQDLVALMYPKEPAASDGDSTGSLLQDTVYAQPAIFVIEYALARLWMHWGVRPDVMVGHSIGEYVAACLAGVFSLPEVLRVLAQRARLMASQPPGSMVSVALSREQVAPWLGDGVCLAACNGPERQVLSGPSEALAKVVDQLSEQGVTTQFLHTSHAYHSEMMEPVVEPFVHQLQQIQRKPPQIPILSTLTGTWLSPDEAMDPGYWGRQLRETVRFDAALRLLQEEQGRVLLEVGPGRTLSTLVLQQDSGRAFAEVIASLGHVQQKERDWGVLLEAVGRLWLCGFPIDWNQFWAGQNRRRVSLPTYPFTRKRFWVAPKPGQGPVNHPVAAAASDPTILGNGGEGEGMNQEVVEVSSEQQESSSAEADPRDRRAAIETAVKEVLNELSGIDVEDMEEDRTFLEMGFDSLFLTQVSLALQKRFQVKITLRLLLENAGTIGELAGYLGERLPADAFVATGQASPAPASSAGESVRPGSNAPPGEPLPLPTVPERSPVSPREVGDADADPSVAERIISQQLEIMRQQLAVLGRSGSTPLVDSTGRPGALDRAERQSAAPKEQPVESRAAGTVADAGDTPSATQRFGPYRPAEKKGGGPLSAQQDRHLRALIERYTRKTRRSKETTQKHRNYFADPRAVAGYQGTWKEMIYPIVSVRSQGSKLWDLDGNEYLDLTMGFGSALFGHSPPFVRQAVEQQLTKGMEIGPQSPIAGEVATAICRMTGMDRATFCNTGSEAVLGALRAARTVTGRHRIAMFSGDYHGVNDEVLVRAHVIRGQRRSFPIAPGIPPEMVANVRVFEYGAEESLDRIEKESDLLAAVLVEPVQSRRPDLQPKEFLKRLRAITQQSGTALIFDEVITGFRLHPRGAQAWFGIDADLATYGKVVGGGMPIGVIAGRSVYMDAFDGGTWQYGDDSGPEAGVTFFAGTFVRHPLTMAAAQAVMQRLGQDSPGLQQQLNERSRQFVGRVNGLFEKARVPVRLIHCGSLIYFDHAADLPFFSLFFFFLREHGVHIWEGRACFLSTAHSDADLDRLVEAFELSIGAMQEGGFWAPVRDHSGPPGTVPRGHAPQRLVGPRGGAPVTEAQREIWLASQLSDTASCAFNESTVLHLRGTFHRQAMEAAIGRIVERHQALRTTFDSHGDRQYVQDSLGIEVPFEDLAALEDTARTARLDGVLAEEAERPFDLEKGPLFRVRILRLSDDYHVMVTTAHHIVCDGWSFDVMIRDLSHVYTLFCEGRQDHRPLPMQITDYARWLEEQKTSAEVVEDERYWLEQFADGVPSLELPADRSRPALKSYRGARQTQWLEPEVYADIKAVGARHGATLFATLLAAYGVLLYRLAGQNDLVIGILAAGQSVVGSHDLVGHCTNLLPLRLRVDGSQPFSQWLSTVRGLVLDAYEHQRVTFGTLVHKLNIKRDPSRTPLVSVLFNIDPAIHGMKFKDLEVEYVANPRCAYQFDMGFNLVAGDTRLISECDYATDLFDADTINRWLRHYHTLIGHIVRDPERRIDELPLLDDDERHRLLVEWNRTEMDYPKQMLVHELVEIQAKRVPEAWALRDEKERIRYGDLNRRANRLAHHLRRLGVHGETFVGVYMGRRIHTVVGLLAILKAGGAYLPLDPAFPKERLEYMLKDSGAPVVLTEEEHLEWLPGHDAQVVVVDRDWDQIATNPPDNLEPGAGPENLAYVMYTSGSTGRPKGVQIPHRAVVNFLYSMREQPGLLETDVLLSVTTLSFDISVLEIFLPLSVGGCTVLVSAETATDGNRLGAALEQYAATVIQGTPVTFRILLEAGWRPQRHLKALIGGEPMPRQLCDQLLALGIEVWNMYGPTETTIWSTVKRMEPGQERITIGRPIGNTRVYVLDSGLQPVPIGVPGRLYIGGDGVARGYLNRPDLTAEKFIANPFNDDSGQRIYDTGDLALYLKDGDLECLGRTDFQAKVRGFRVEPGEIETVLSQHPDVVQAAVVVRPDRAGENQLVGYVVAPGGKSLGVSDLKQYLREKLPEYMVPSRFMFLPALPLTPNGKVDRQALPPVPERRDPEGDEHFVAATDVLEMQLTQLWESVLGVKPVGIKDNFFDIGGHSLHAARLFAKIEKVMGFALPLATLFQAPTIELLAQVLREQRGDPTWSSLVPIQPGGSKPPLFFVHGAGGNVLLYRDLSKHLGPDQPFFGLQAQGLDGKAPVYQRFEEMAEHYLGEVRRLQPEGPYYLGGYCLGGAIALEMAQQLFRQGEQVALLALVETYNLQAAGGVLPFPYELYHRVQNLKYHWDNLRLSPGGSKWGFLSTKGKTTVRRARLRLMIRLSRAARLLRLPWGEQYPHVNLTQLNDQAHYRYVPQSYPGRITLFRPQKHYAGLDDDQFGWGALAQGGVEVHVLPVLPRGTLVEPFVRELAAQLADCVARAGNP